MKIQRREERFETLADGTRFLEQELKKSISLREAKCEGQGRESGRGRVNGQRHAEVGRREELPASIATVHSNSLKRS